MEQPVAKEIRIPIEILNQAPAQPAPHVARLALVVIRSRSCEEEPPSELVAVRLTPREKEVARLLLQGYVCKEIACKLTISVSTVHHHIRNLYDKLQVDNRASLVVVLLLGAHFSPEELEELRG
jgi:DNA-binding NarL/FixJ family response regulator